MNLYKRVFLGEVGNGSVGSVFPIVSFPCPDITIYCYWDLEMQDLVHYDDDLSSGKLKQLLCYLWSRLKITDEDKNNDNARTQIAKYGLFENPKKYPKHVCSS